MDSKEYPPRYCCKIVDSTKDQKFFDKPNILMLKLKGGTIHTMDGDTDTDKRMVQIDIPSYSG